MPIIYSAFGNAQGQELSNYFDPESDGGNEILSKMRVESGATPTRVSFFYAEGGFSVRIVINGQFPPTTTGTLFNQFIQSALNGSPTKIEIYLNGQLSQTEEYIGSFTFASLNLWDSVAGLQAGFSGNDVFYGSTTAGQNKGDNVNGYSGDDNFHGNGDGGDNHPDRFFGGAGADTAFYRGPKSNYTITAIAQIWDPQTKSLINTSGKGFRLKDNTGLDGTDELYEVEWAQFSDQKFSLIAGASQSTNTTSSSTPSGSGASTESVTGGSMGTSAAATTSANGQTSAPTTATTSTTTPTTTAPSTTPTGATPAATTPASPAAPTTPTIPVATTPVAPIIPNGTEKVGSDTVDRLQGGSGPDVIRAGGGNDIIIGSDGTDYIDGGTGIDQISYTSRAGSISFAQDTGGNIQVRLGNKTDTLKDVERVSFTDKAYALDLGGSAGVAAKAIIAAFGKNTVSQYLGVALTMTDKGSSAADLAKIVMDNKMLPSDHGQFVQTVFNNVVGRAPNALEMLQFKGILDRGEMNTTQLLAVAAESPFTTTVINEVAIAGVALEYQPTLTI